MTDLNDLIALRKFYNLGADFVRQDKTLHEIIHGEFESDDPDEPGRSFDDLEPIESSALLLGYAVTLEDVLRECPKGKVKKAKKKVFHTDKLELDDDD